MMTDSNTPETAWPVKDANDAGNDSKSSSEKLNDASLRDMLLQLIQANNNLTMVVMHLAESVKDLAQSQDDDFEETTPRSMSNKQ